MQFAFRHLSEQDIAQVPAGELLIHLAAASPTAGRAYARHVVEHGLAGLPQGEGPIERIVVPEDPTLDDMLAAEFSSRLLAGEKLPAGCSAFARYAALAREGLKPDQAPVDCSLEGIFLAIRNDAGVRLSDADAAAAFNAQWSRLAESIFAAAAAGIDPLAKPFLADNPEFGRERAFLRHDHDVFQQDVQRGEEWVVEIPGGPPNSYGLLLHSPKSLLFKYWSRDPQYGPRGKPYLFLAVDWGENHWVFSTDPVQRLSLLALYEQLQKAEQAADPTEGAQHGWFNGAPYSHRLIAAPKRGSRLTSESVLRIVKQWTHAKALSAAEKANKLTGVEAWSKWAAVISAAVAVITLVLGVTRSRESNNTIRSPDKIVSDADGKKTASRSEIKETITSLAGKSGNEVLRGAAEKSGLKLTPGKQQSVDLLTFNPTQVDQHVRLNLRLQAKDAQQTGNLKVLSFYVNGEALPRYADFELRDGQWQTKLASAQSEGDRQSLAALFHRGQNKVTVTAATDGSEPVEMQARLEWQIDAGYLPDLHVLTIGVGDTLPNATADAQSLSDFFHRTDAGLLFANVHSIDPPLVKERASKTAIFDALHQLNLDAKQGDVVVIAVSAHGAVVDNRYYLIPANSNEADLSIAKLNDSAISRDDFLSALKPLEEKCYVLVVLDTCHAAALADGNKLRSPAASVDMSQVIDTQSLIQRMGSNPTGVVVIAACLGSEPANDLGVLGHGVLTFALLEGLEGKLMYRNAATDDCEQFLPRERVVSLADLNYYIEKRVKRLTRHLTSREQSIVTTPLQGISLGDIPLIVRPLATSKVD